jgi:hypothetical protein
MKDVAADLECVAVANPDTLADAVRVALDYASHLYRRL